MASDFWELYKHPLWQKKRLEVMQREDFTCERCGDTGSTLNVHHAFYRKDAKPWEYPSESLHCLCEVCHSNLHDSKERLLFYFSAMSLASAERLIGYAFASYADDQMKKIIVTNYEEAEGVSEYFRVPVETIISLSGNGFDETDIFPNGRPRR